MNFCFYLGKQSIRFFLKKKKHAIFILARIKSILIFCFFYYFFYYTDEYIIYICEKFLRFLSFTSGFCEPIQLLVVLFYRLGCKSNQVHKWQRPFILAALFLFILFSIKYTLTCFYYLIYVYCILACQRNTYIKNKNT